MPKEIRGTTGQRFKLESNSRCAEHTWSVMTSDSRKYSSQSHYNIPFSRFSLQDVISCIIFHGNSTAFWRLAVVFNDIYKSWRNTETVKSPRSIFQNSVTQTWQAVTHKDVYKKKFEYVFDNFLHHGKNTSWEKQTTAKKKFIWRIRNPSNQPTKFI
jgi:hypothetical protein